MNTTTFFFSFLACLLASLTSCRPRDRETETETERQRQRDSDRESGGRHLDGVAVEAFEREERGDRLFAEVLHLLAHRVAASKLSTLAAAMSTLAESCQLY